MTWEEIMRRVLPPVGGLSPHVTSAFGATNRPPGSTNPHRAVDFNYNVGRNGQQGINLTHPLVHSPVAGVVTHTGGKYGTIAIKDANGLSHEILHTQTQNVRKGDLVGVGTPIGTMGNTGADAQHVHYQLKDRAGNVINPTEFWNNLDPGKDDPGQPAFLDQSKRAAEIASGGIPTSVAFQRLLPVFLRLTHRLSHSSVRSAIRHPDFLAEIHWLIASANGVLSRFPMRRPLPTIHPILSIVLASGI